MAFGGILGHLGLVWGLFGVISVGVGVSDVILEHLGSFCGIWGWFGGFWGHFHGV